MTFKQLHSVLCKLTDNSTEPGFKKALDDAIIWLEVKYDWVIGQLEKGRRP